MVRHLLQSGADPSLANHKGELPADITLNQDVLSLLPNGSLESRSRESDFVLPFIPNYLKNPPFPYYDMTGDHRSPDHAVVISTPDTVMPTDRGQMNQSHADTSNHTTARIGDQLNDTELIQARPPPRVPPLIIKARLADSGDSDFVEVEVEKRTHEVLLRACCEELNVSADKVNKIRKLPNVIIRRDKDVQRLETGQELELVVVT